jgi:hypothetical protein
MRAGTRLEYKSVKRATEMGYLEKKRKRKTMTTKKKRMKRTTKKMKWWWREVAEAG